jgi:uncharacterized protein YyaL (SSP411 family)
MPESTPFSSSLSFPTGDVAWREWNPELFEDPSIAEQLRLLVVAPAWHPDLHEFDRVLFNDSRLQEALAAGVTPIRVDADERPDVARRYAEDGELGLALLSPGGAPLVRFRATIAPEVLEAIRHWQARWRDERDEVLAEIEAEQVVRLASIQAVPGELTPSALDLMLDRANEASEPAGPQQIALWLYADHRRADRDAERRARMAIQRRVDGEGFDHERGGFQRDVGPDSASVVRLTEDQGHWLRVLARVAGEDGDAHEWARDAVVQTIDFVEAELLNSNGGFQQGADDQRVFATANAALARGLLACGVVFGRSDWRSRGQTAVDFLVRQMRAGEAGYHHGWDGVPYTLGLLVDQIATGQALLDAHEVTGSIDYLHHAQTIALLLERQFQTPNGMLADLDIAHEADGLLEEPRFDLLDQALAADLLIRLTHLTHDDRYVDSAYALLGAVAGAMEQADLEAGSAIARTIDRILSVEAEIKIVTAAPPGEYDGIADPLHTEALRLSLAAHTVQRLNPDFDDVLSGQLGLPMGPPGAYCFVLGGYGALLTRPDELLPAIERGLSEMA